MTGVSDVWAGGGAYQQYVGRWSRLVARDFLAWIAVAPCASWLDVGCGPYHRGSEKTEKTALFSVISVPRW